MPTLTVRVLGRRADRASISVPLAPQDRGGKNAGTRAARNVSVNRADERCRAPQTRRAPRRPPTRSKPKSRAGLVRTTRDPAGKEQDICACLPKIRRLAAVRLRCPSILHALRWRHRREDLAVVRWNLHREKAALAAPYDIEGYAHAQRERLGGSAGCLFAHDAPHFAQWHVVLQTAFSRARFLVRKPGDPAASPRRSVPRSCCRCRRAAPSGECPFQPPGKPVQPPRAPPTVWATHPLPLTYTLAMQRAAR
jgi:hypothetical protein